MHFTLRQHAQDFLMHCRQKGHSPGTMAAYKVSLDKFLTYADSAGVTRAEDVTRQLMRSYANHLSEVLSPGAAHARLRPVKTFFRWLEDDEVIKESPMKRVAMPKLPRQILPAIDADQVQQLMDVARETRHPLRDRAVLAVLFDTGVRVSELCGLELEDVLVGGRLNIRQAKGGRGRVVPISRAALRHLTKYINTERPEVRLPYVFLANDETPLKTATASSRCSNACAARPACPTSRRIPSAGGSP